MILKNRFGGKFYSWGYLSEGCLYGIKPTPVKIKSVRRRCKPQNSFWIAIVLILLVQTILKCNDFTRKNFQGVVFLRINSAGKETNKKISAHPQRILNVSVTLFISPLLLPKFKLTKESMSIKLLFWVRNSYTECEINSAFAAKEDHGDFGICVNLFKNMYFEGLES